MHDALRRGGPDTRQGRATSVTRSMWRDTERCDPNQCGHGGLRALSELRHRKHRGAPVPPVRGTS
eukprot:6855197-Lingulodinium_polyedra.AAC.1